MHIAISSCLQIVTKLLDSVCIIEETPQLISILEYNHDGYAALRFDLDKN
jgi:hypothetical protein